MAAVESYLNEDAGAKKRRRQMIISILIGVVILHVAAGVVAGIFVVAKYIFPPPANFVVKKDIRLPAKKREHKMNMAALDAVAPKPTLSDKMQSTRPTAFSLPDVPDMPLDQMLPLDPSQLVADQVASLSNTDAMGTASGAAVAGSGGFGGKGVEFFGIQSSGSRILLMFDVSTSVKSKAEKAGFPFSKVKEKTMELFEKLPITSKFGVISFGIVYKSFGSEMLPLTKDNKELFRSWMDSEWDSIKNTTKNPYGIVGVLEFAQSLKPEVIYIISDGDFQWKPTGKIVDVPWNDFQRSIQKFRESKCPVNFIIFEPSEETIKELRRAASITGGKFIEPK
jgi:hypothetical protein